MHRIGIESLTALSLTPVELVDLAADLGCGFIGTPLSPFALPQGGIAQWSLRDPPAQREFKAALANRGVALGLGQGFGIAAGSDVADRQRDLDILCELGARTICGVSFDPDHARTLDQLATLAAMARPLDIEVLLEFVPTTVIADLPAALHALQQIDAPNMHLLLDTMHHARAGGSPADLAALPPGSVGYIQLSDVPLTPAMPSYLDEAVCARLVPGTGELPLAAILAALPRDIPIGLEVPMSPQALARGGAHNHVRACVEATRRLLAT